MILNHSKTIRSVISLLCISIMISPACFSTFYQCAMVSTLVENSNFFVYLYILYLMIKRGRSSVEVQT